MKPLAEIVKLNQTRYGLDFNGQKAIEKLHEEIVEELVPAIKAADLDEIVDALNDTIVIAVGELTKLHATPKALPTKIVAELSIIQPPSEKLSDKLEQFKLAVEANDTPRMIVILDDIILISAESLLEINYQPTLTLKQVVKAISSREQDPIQAQAWATGNRQPGEKWKKNSNQDPETLYKADFSTCKFK